MGSNPIGGALWLIRHGTQTGKASLTKRKRGFDSLRDDSRGSVWDDGPRVCWRHASLVKRGTEFDSRADLWWERTIGRLVQREDAWLATRRSGFDSPAGPLV